MYYAPPLFIRWVMFCFHVLRSSTLHSLGDVLFPCTTLLHSSFIGRCYVSMYYAPPLFIHWAMLCFHIPHSSTLHSLGDVLFSKVYFLSSQAHLVSFRPKSFNVFHIAVKIEIKKLVGIHASVSVIF